MAIENGKNTLLTTLVFVLVVVVAVLAYKVFQTNTQLETLLTQNEASAPAPSDSGEQAIARVAPNLGQTDPWSVFSTPFDPDHWDPFSEMDNMQRRIDAMFNDALGRFGKTARFGDLLTGPAFTPRMDLVDEGDLYVVRLDIPGAENSEIKVSLENQTLTVEAVSRLGNEQDEDGVLRRERRMGRFRRQITLPEPVSADAPETNYEDGVLTITIKKAS